MVGTNIQHTVSETHRGALLVIAQWLHNPAPHRNKIDVEASESR